MDDEVLEKLGQKIKEASIELDSEELSEVFLPIQFELRINLKKISDDDVKISLFLLDALLSKIMGQRVEKAIFGDKDADGPNYNTFFKKHLDAIAEAIISKDNNLLFNNIKTAILEAGKFGLLKI